MNRTRSVVSPAIVLGAAALAFMSGDQCYVVFPGLVCCLIVLWLWMSLWDRDRQIPFFDIGMFCALATLAYTVYPLANYWADGLQFGPLADRRLQSYNITPAQLGVFHLRHVVYLFSIVVMYSLYRRPGLIHTGTVSAPTRSGQQVIVSSFLTLTACFFLLHLTTGVNYQTSYESNAYAENRAAIANLPLLAVQTAGKLWSILFLFKLALLGIVVRHCAQAKWRLILLLWIGAVIIQAVCVKGARTDLVLFLMATGLFYHRMVKPLTMKLLLAAGSVLFAGFIFMGFYRAYVDVDEMQSHLSQSNAGILAGNNEFQSLLGTAYDVLHRKEAGAVLPWYLYINDFISLLPPQQLLPFEKVTAAEWYLREIGISGLGQGLMWGCITQAIVGLDWLELVLRGAVLGYILARIHRWYLNNQTSFLATLVYVFLCVRVYYTFRSTTFSLLANVVWQIIPFCLIMHLTGTQMLPTTRPIRRSYFSR